MVTGLLFTVVMKPVPGVKPDGPYSTSQALALDGEVHDRVALMPLMLAVRLVGFSQSSVVKVIVSLQPLVRVGLHRPATIML